MPLNTSKSSKISLSFLETIKTKFKIYGCYWTFRLTFERIYRILFFQILKKSYSEYAEDLIVEKLLKNKKNIFYVDIGANHPKKFNNTYHFYLLGHRGINIDPNQYLINLYRHVRPADTNLSIGISDKNSSMTFYLLDPHVNSTFSRSRYLYYLADGTSLVSKIKTPVLSFVTFLQQYCSHQDIDFLSIDAEGVEDKILKNIPWKTCHPAVICLETFHDNSLSDYLYSKGYRLDSRTGLNSIFYYDQN